MWVYIARQYLFWILKVPVLASLPIAIHLGTVFVNNHQPDDMPVLQVANGFLYVFIVTMTAVTDALQGNRRLSSMYYLIFAVLAAVLYAATLLDAVADRAISQLRGILLIFFWGTFTPYACSKALELYGVGKAEWEESLKKARVTG